MTPTAPWHASRSHAARFDLEGHLGVPLLDQVGGGGDTSNSQAVISGGRRAVRPCSQGPRRRKASGGLTGEQHDDAIVPDHLECGEFPAGQQCVPRRCGGASPDAPRSPRCSGSSRGGERPWSRQPPAERSARRSRRWNGDHLGFGRLHTGFGVGVTHGSSPSGGAGSQGTSQPAEKGARNTFIRRPEKVSPCTRMHCSNRTGCR